MTKAVDTNVVVRLFVDDGSKQVPIARQVFKQESIEISLTVVLEFEWVLRSVYKFKPPAICEVLDVLLNLENVYVQRDDLVQGALEAHRVGVDFADAIHLLSTARSDEFLTFDENLRRRAETINHPISVCVPTLQA